MIKIAFITTGLSRGGAERMLLKLLSAIDRTKFEPAIFCLTQNLSLMPEIETLGVRVHSYKFNSPIFCIFSLISFIRDCQKFAPDILQGWMYHGNVFASIARCFVSSKVSFGIRVALYNFNYERLLTRYIIRLGAKLSQQADKIIYVSHVAQTHHESVGYSGQTAIVIPNGFDLIRFQPNESQRQEYRQRLQLSDDTIAVGYFARFHKMKGHVDLIHAFADVSARHPTAKLILAGAQIDERNHALTEVIRTHRLDKKVILLGELSCPERVLPALDIFVSPSHQEGFPNVVGEAMACGLACVVTDVGDSALAVGDTGIVVPSQNPQGLGAAINQMINEHQMIDWGIRARQRVETEFELSVIVKKYEKVYKDLMAEKS